MSNVREIWENAMINLVIDFPIYAEIITKIGCKFVKAGKESAVAWTDGRAITINEEMVEEFNQQLQSMKKWLKSLTRIQSLQIIPVNK